MTDYASRQKWAREHAGLTKAELSRRSRVRRTAADGTGTEHRIAVGAALEAA